MSSLKPQPGRWLDHSRVPSWIGPLLIFATTLVGLILWLGSKVALQDWFEHPPLYFSKTCALSGMQLMAWTMILSSRWRLLELIFGGQDRVYRWHRQLGRLSFILLLLHPIFLASIRLPSVEAFMLFFMLPEPFPYTNYMLGSNIGSIALVLLIGLIILASFKLAPYKRWLSLHRWMGVVYLLGMWHVALLERDISLYPLLNYWMWGWMIAGLLAWCNIRLFRWTANSNRYFLERLERRGDLLIMSCQPSQQPFLFLPGQWCFVSTPSVASLGERHPLSMISPPHDDGRVRFGVRVVGPWTEALTKLSRGDELHLYGPFGVFGDHFLRGDRDVVCIGGGIGITPFLSIWSSALNSDEKEPEDPTAVPFNPAGGLKAWRSPRVNLIYLVRDFKEAIFDASIKEAAVIGKFKGQGHADCRGHKYWCLLSKPESPLSLLDIQEQTIELAGKRILMCGPHAMLMAFREQACLLGIPDEMLASEEFEWRGL